MAGLLAQGGAQARDRALRIAFLQLHAGQIALHFDAVGGERGGRLQRCTRLGEAAELEQGQAMQAGELDVLRRFGARARRERLRPGRVIAVEQTGQLVV